MKKWIAVLLFVVGVTATKSTTAQTKSNDEVLALKEKRNSLQPMFTCQTIIQDPETRVMTLLENVSVNTEKFKVANAGKVVYDEKAKKIAVYDCKEFTMAGRIVTKTGIKKNNVIEYTIGEDTAYML